MREGGLIPDPRRTAQNRNYPLPHYPYWKPWDFRLPASSYSLPTVPTFEESGRKVSWADYRGHRLAEVGQGSRNPSRRHASPELADQKTRQRLYLSSAMSSARLSLARASCCICRVEGPTLGVERMMDGGGEGSASDTVVHESK